MHATGYTVRVRGEYKVLEVDTSKAAFKGHLWKQMGSWGRQKYENWIFFENVQKEPTLPVKFLYG